MKIKSIYIDGLHNAVNKEYEFGDIVYIFGNNGIGKSTILQAIQFALLGYIPGTSKTKDAILRHSPKGRILVRLALYRDEIDNPDIAHTIYVERCISKTMNQVDTMPDIDLASIINDLELPIFNFNDFVGQTANKLKEYFIKHILPTVDGKPDWEHILSESIADCNFDNRDEIIQYGMSLVEDIDGEMLDQVVKANAKFKEEQSFNKSEMQRLQNTIDSLIYYDDYVGPTNIDDLNAKLLSLNAIRDQVIRYNSAVEATKSTSAELERLRAEITSFGGKETFEKINAELPVLQKQYNDLIDSIQIKQNALAALRAADTASSSIIQSNGICPYTKAECKSIKDKIEDLRNESVERKAHNASLSVEIDGDIAKSKEISAMVSAHQKAVDHFRQIWDRITTLENTMGELPAKPNTDKDLIELDREIDALTQSKSKLEANIRYNETIENITNLKYEAELHGNALSCWVKKTDTNGLQTTIMATPFEELATTMTSYIQQMYGTDSLKAHFNIESKANSFSFGLIRDGVYIPYDLLSSGEKCLYTLALMICIVNNNPSPLKVMLLDDAFDHLDSSAIENTFATLKNVSGIQFIFAGVKECSNAADIVLTV